MRPHPRLPTWGTSLDYTAAGGGQLLRDWALAVFGYTFGYILRGKPEYRPYMDKIVGDTPLLKIVLTTLGDMYLVRKPAPRRV